MHAKIADFMEFSPSLHPQIQAIVEDIETPSSLFFPKNLLEHFQAFDTIIILGIGGPALCGRVLQSIIAAQRSHGQKLIFRDNLAPLDLKDYPKHTLEKTGIVILSKSGETLETLFETQEFLKLYQSHNLPVQDYFLIATEHPHRHPENPNHLYRIAREHQIETLPLSSKIDGRFSLFAATGQIFGTLMGLDMHTFRRGAKAYIQSLTTEIFMKKEALFQSQSHLNDHVLWIYDERLLPLVAWWAQLIGESLGKHGEGLSPLIAVGPKDQHSQLQLYLGGPRNKYFTFLSTAPSFEHLSSHLSHKFPHHIQHLAPELNLEALFNIGVKDIIALQMHMVIDTMTDEAIPNRLFHVKLDDIFEMGKLCMEIMVEIWLSGLYRGIDPFGQPDIEKVKQKVLDLLQRV